MAKKQYKTLEELQTALQEELKKDSPDTKVLTELVEQQGKLVQKVFEAENKKAESAADKIEKLQSQIKELKAAPDLWGELEETKTELAEVKEKLAEVELEAKDPNAARMRAINEGKHLVLDIEDSGKAFQVKFQFKRKQFSVPGFGEIKAVEVIKNPDRFQKVISRLIERKSPILVEMSRKPLKKGGK